MQQTCEPNRWKGFICGLLGSVAGLTAMSLYWQYVAPALSDESSNNPGEKSGEDRLQPLDDISLTGKQYRDGESSTAALGRILYQQVTGQEPKSPETRTALSYLVHWGYGLGQGGLYGAARSSVNNLDLAGGVMFGAGLWLLGDELVVPLLGLQGGPTTVSSAQHTHRLGAHVAYGLGLAAATQLLRRLF
ncbi:MAG: hypothetical protein KJ077_43145 [Anaerolineae bacterium]|nr:hypothetical protein [Anaerolineae bacterium]